VPCAGRFMCYVCMCIHAERARGRGPLVHMWNSGSGVNVATSPRPLHISRIDHRCSDAQGLRNPESRQPRGAAAGRRRSGPTHLTPELQNGRDPARMSSQRLTRGVAPHAQTPKSRRSDSQDCEENPSLFGFLLGTRDARGSICRAQTLGGPALSPSARAGVSTLSLEVRWAVAKDISVTAMFRIEGVVDRSLG